MRFLKLARPDDTYRVSDPLLGPYTMLGGNGNDTITGTLSAYFMFGRLGDEGLSDSGRSDWRFAGDGDDTLHSPDSFSSSAILGAFALAHGRDGDDQR